MSGGRGHGLKYHPTDKCKRIAERVLLAKLSHHVHFPEIVRDPIHICHIENEFVVLSV